MKTLLLRLKGNIPKGNTCVVIYTRRAKQTSVIAEVLDVMTGKSLDLVYMAKTIEEARKEIKAAGYKVQEFRDLFQKGNVQEMWYRN